MILNNNPVLITGELRFFSAIPQYRALVWGEFTKRYRSLRGSITDASQPPGDNAIFTLGD